MKQLTTFALVALIACGTYAQDEIKENQQDENILLQDTYRPPLTLNPSLRQGYELSLVPYLSYRLENPGLLLNGNLLSRLGVGFRQITDEALRKQLQLHENEGLVVISIEQGSIAENAGLERFAVVRSINGDSIRSVNDVVSAYQKVDDGVGLKWDVVQIGKARSLSIAKPVSQQSSGTYRIGVNIKAADDVLKSHLGIRENTGLIITGIITDSPAEKAGLKVNDVLTVAGKALLPTPDHLNGVTQSSKEDKVTYKYFRGGQEYTVEISASDNVGNEVRSTLVPGRFIYSPRAVDFTYGGPAYGYLRSRLDEANSDSKLDRLMKKIEAMETQLKEIRKELESHKK